MMQSVSSGFPAKLAVKSPAEGRTMLRYVTAVGLSVAAGVALLEVALVPAVAIGGVAVLLPRYLPRLRPKKPTRRPRLTVRKNPEARTEILPPRRDKQSAASPATLLARLGIKQAVAKTVTFRVIVTSLDFTSNYVVLGELTTAAGLSTLNLIGGPLFYLAHETMWNYLGPPGATVEVTAPTALPEGPAASSAGWHGITVSRALAKTVTYRAIATVVDFTTNYVVVGDAVVAAGLAAFGFILGPFVYFGHERAWEYFGGPQELAAEPLPPANVARPLALPTPTVAHAGQA